MDECAVDPSNDAGTDNKKSTAHVECIPPPTIEIDAKQSQKQSESNLPFL